MEHECFDVTIDEGIAHVRMIRPEKRNAMGPAFWRELPAIVRDLDGGARARVVVLSSTGPHFTSGMDVSAFAPRDGEEDPVARRARGARFYDNVLHLQQSFNCLEECRIPVLAAIQGGCIGGGVDLATACDLRYITEDGFFTIFETNIGMTADVGTFPRICKLIPEGVARELAYTGRRMGAEEALRHGLVNAVHPDHESLLAGVMEVAREIASKAPLTIYGCKRMIHHARDHRVADTLDYIGIWNASMLHVEEIGEAMTARREGRPGRFAELPPRRSHEADDAG